MMDQNFLVHDGFSYLVPLQGPLFLRRTRGAGLSDSGGKTKARGIKLLLVAGTLLGLLQMMFRRPRILVYANDLMTDQESFDPRMAAVYRWLFPRGDFGNVIHATPQHETLRRWMRRRGPVVYYEAFEAVARILLRMGWVRPAFTASPRSDELERWMIRQANITAATVPILRWMFGFIRPKQLWLMDDPRYWHQLVFAARRAGIRTILFQHGRFNSHMSVVTYDAIPPIFIPLPDVYIVWNDYWRRRLLEISPPFTARPDIVRVGGHPGRVGVPRTLHGGKAVVIVYEPGHDVAAYRDLLERLSSVGGYRWLYKVRPNLPEQAQVDRYGLRGIVEHDQLRIITSMPQEVGLVLGTYSTLLYEMVQAGIPVGVVKTRDTQAEDLVHANLAKFIDPAEALEPQLLEALSVSDEELARRAQHLAVTADITKTLDELNLS